MCLVSIMPVMCDVNIYFFRTDEPHFLIIAYADRERLCTRVFRGSLVAVLEKLDERFFRCARDFVVNVDKIAKIDKSNYHLILDDGSSVEIASNHIKTVEALISFRKNAIK